MPCRVAIYALMEENKNIPLKFVLLKSASRVNPQARADLHKMLALVHGSVVLQFVSALVGELRPLLGRVAGEVSAHADGGSVGGRQSANSLSACIENGSR